MRWLAVLLLLTNVSWFGWEYYQYLQQRMLQRLQARQVVKVADLPANIPSLKLLSELDGLPPLIEAQQQTADTQAAVSETLATADIARLDGVCYRLGPFAEVEQAKILQDDLRSRQIDVWLMPKEITLKKLFWVYLEPMDSAEKAREKVAELRSKGVKDYMLIHSGNLKNAISLGLFSYQNTVNRRLAELAQEGYKPVVVPRYKTRKEFWLDLHTLQERLPDIPLQDKIPQPVDCSSFAKRPGGD